MGSQCTLLELGDRYWALGLPAAAKSALARAPAQTDDVTPALRLTNRSEVIGFNESLPCGARLVRTETRGRFIVATFVLTERPGSGQCGAGVGQTARTAFVIRDGRIAEWRRVADQSGAQPAPQGPVI